MKRLMNNLLKLVLSILGCAAIGCAAADIDRSYVNDPKMDIRSKTVVSDYAPLSGLTSRNKAGEGASCSVCAH